MYIQYKLCSHVGTHEHIVFSFPTNRILPNKWLDYYNLDKHGPALDSACVVCNFTQKSRCTCKYVLIAEEAYILNT